MTEGYVKLYRDHIVVTYHIIIITRIRLLKEFTLQDRIPIIQGRGKYVKLLSPLTSPLKRALSSSSSLYLFM
jgi:hypothetical protein